MTPLDDLQRALDAFNARMADKPPGDWTAADFAEAEAIARQVSALVIGASMALAPVLVEFARAVGSIGIGEAEEPLPPLPDNVRELKRREPG